jgi:acetylornithine deacetylase/succinyl-diaminopimelate desuccinylase-like protein
MKKSLTSNLDARVAELAARDRELASSILKEVVRIPHDYVDRPEEEGGDPLCGLSNHEKPRLDFLKKTIIEIGAVRDPGDVGYDTYGNLVWTVDDLSDGVPGAEKTIILFDGHTDTVQALRTSWHEKLGGGVDAYEGLTDESCVNWGALESELGHLPPDEEREHLIFGRGTVDQLSGVVSQVIATRILLELAEAGALRGVIVRSFATVSMRRELPGAPPEQIPDVVVLTEPTGDAEKGPLRICRGQRGRMQIEVEVRGRSSHGSMPWLGLNPLEYGGAIVAEAARRYDERAGFLDDPFLGQGSRTASFATLDTPSDCAVPERFVFRFDRRLTIGEVPEQAVADIDSLEAVRAARAAGLEVDVRVPTYDVPTWKGTNPGNPQIYMGWATPEDHPAVRAAMEAYRGTVSPHIGPNSRVRHEPLVDRWNFSTDGVGYPVPADDTSIDVAESKQWVESGAVKHPPMIGFGPGVEQNAHKIGESVDARELVHAAAFLARFPSVFSARRS